MTLKFQDRRNKHSAVRKALVLRSSNLGHKVVRGAGFILSGVALRTLITLGSISILARILTPSDFGYIAMATVITELAALFGNLGFAAVLIQRRVITRLQMDTVFWASALLGIVLAASVFSLSYVATGLFNEPIAGEILRILSINFIVAEFSVVHSALIVRSMKFHADFLIQITSRLGSATIAIVCAWQGLGVWSLVFGSLATPAIKVILSWSVMPYLPRIRFNFSYIRKTWKTNSSYFASGFVTYANANIDIFFIGRALGATALGFYQNSRSLTDEVRIRLAAPLQRVLFPAFSSLQDNIDWLQHSVLRSGRLLAAIIFPVGIGLSAVSNELVPILYGAKWLAMIPVIKMLGISAAIRASTAVAIPLYNSRNKIGLALRYNLIGTILMLFSVWIATPWGIGAVAAAVALSSVYSLLTFRAGLGLIGLGWKSVQTILLPPAISSASMWLAIAALRPYTTDLLNSNASVFFLHIGLGIAVYCVALIFTYKGVISDFKSAINKVRPASPRTSS